MYRIVWADTRKSKIIVNGKRREVSRYVHGEEAKCAGHWVMEKWAPGEVLWGMTKEQYEAMLVQMPGLAAEQWPEKGDYEFSYLFEGSVDPVFVHKQIAMHEFKLERTTMRDRMDAMEQAEDKKEKIADEQFENLYEAAREETLCQ